MRFKALEAKKLGLYISAVALPSFFPKHKAVEILNYPVTGYGPSHTSLYLPNAPLSTPTPWLPPGASAFFPSKHTDSLVKTEGEEKKRRDQAY